MVKRARLLNSDYWYRKCCAWCHGQPSDTDRRVAKRRERQSVKREIKEAVMQPMT